MLVSWFLFLVIFGSESGCLRLEKQAFGKVLQKSTFAALGFLMIPGYNYHDFGSLGTNFHDFFVFVALETGLKFMSLQSDSGVTPDPAPRRVEGKLVHPRALVTLFQDP